MSTNLWESFRPVLEATTDRGFRSERARRVIAQMDGVLPGPAPSWIREMADSQTHESRWVDEDANDSAARAYMEEVAQREGVKVEDLL